ncbi:hypothetical protein BEWA_018260 [Theileria equi strain WA]|uniref:Uncharacterized protein n=1 Tax=Theileria equi strain WA TaxID=1537102 RepID=L0AUS9_THEEQ|nr:hypothetical protein BEWA_018260 [Theileria equi strain WA]AFZ78983.1 hypothetical protein BEWA_018260 [Theileria equi strain WA]|eukprot:XP_004828649.1 hypothetical protein BEWA_018260 [Theileria equi strain WA]
MNIFFYQKYESTLVSQLQNTFSFIITNWDLPSKSSLVESFVTELEKVIDNTSTKKTYEIELSNYEPRNMLSCLLYMLHYKLRNEKRKQYLLYDPKFKMFKTRQSVVNFLKDNGIFNYKGITLTRNGFLVESHNTLEIPHTIPLLSYKRLNSHIKNVKRRIEKSCISSPVSRRLLYIIYPVNLIHRKMYNKLVKEEENKIVKRLRFKL